MTLDKKEAVVKEELEVNDKERSLFEAAYELFLEKGINDTSINSIAKRAGVGKGTFYLYFENKYDILDRIILEKSRTILNDAINRTREEEYLSFEDEVLAFTDFIIEFLKENKLLLKLIYKNLSWGVFRQAYEDYDEISEIYQIFERGYEGTDLEEAEIQKRLFMILELTGSVAYSAIILNEPADIDDMKESLFYVISKIL